MLEASSGFFSEEEAALVWLDFVVRRAPLPPSSAAEVSSEDASGRRRELRPMKAFFVSGADGGKKLQGDAAVPAVPLVASLREAMGFPPARAGV